MSNAFDPNDQRDLPEVIADACVKFCAHMGPEYLHRTIQDVTVRLEMDPGNRGLVIMLSKLEALRDRVDPLLPMALPEPEPVRERYP